MGRPYMKHLHDRELILQLQQGSLDALGELFSRYRETVFRTAFAITGDSDAANDLLQDVFLRLHRFSGHIDTNRPLEPWLYRMTANLSYTWIKQKQKRTSLIEEIADWFEKGSERTSPHELAEEKDVWEQILHALHALPLQQRVVVVLYYMNDLSLQEISEILDVPLGTVKSRLHYGRRALKNKLKLQQLRVGEKFLDLKYENS
jgi:RNA polymerase sigma-70 factor (ECF subfamily)